MTIWRTRITCWIPKATNTHSDYIILISFLLQQWLHERTSVSHSRYIACFVYILQLFSPYMDSYSYREGFPVHVAVIAENCPHEAVEGYLETTTASYINPFSRTSEVPNADFECTGNLVKTNKDYNV